MSSCQTLLDRLDKVRQVAPGRWITACPAHRDRSPSLSVRELEDGRILLHDFGGCGTSAVLDAIGMELADLFPGRITDHGRPVRPNHYHAAREALQALADDVLLVGMAAESLAAGIALTKADRDKLLEAAVRISQARESTR